MFQINPDRHTDTMSQ